MSSPDIKVEVGYKQVDNKDTVGSHTVLEMITYEGDSYIDERQFPVLKSGPVETITQAIRGVEQERLSCIAASYFSSALLLISGGVGAGIINSEAIRQGRGLRPEEAAIGGVCIVVGTILGYWSHKLPRRDVKMLERQAQALVEFAMGPIIRV